MKIWNKLIEWDSAFLREVLFFIRFTSNTRLVSFDLNLYEYIITGKLGLFLINLPINS
ncbi:hypothetical protein GCM10011346_36630 [Oceanobacillus neutriphilus]|uniref:Uncharacterized protein n=1 Tax=Oceanobacillus neutriphilus TaxID=531815 RepID=A0ABQ2NZ07_9BACI|nr:hypothetical protein GCM10011346_36630 [Oceanobacillus neutriphilus]